MIQIKTLKKRDIGEWVTYTDDAGTVEHGRIKSWNDSYIFVVYKCGNDWDNFQNFTGNATSPDSLVWRDKHRAEVESTVARVFKAVERIATDNGETLNSLPSKTLKMLTKAYIEGASDTLKELKRTDIYKELFGSQEALNYATGNKRQTNNRTSRTKNTNGQRDNTSRTEQTE